MNPLNLGSLNIHYILALGGVFVAVGLAVIAIIHFVVKPLQERRLLQQRLRGNKRDQEARTNIFKAYQEVRGSSPLLTLVQQIIGFKWVDYLQRLLLQADIYINPSSFLSLLGILGSAGLLLGVIIDSMLWGLALAVILILLPIMFLQWRKSRKTVMFEKQMPDAMELLARSMRTGHTLSGTLELVSQEIGPPLGTEFRITYEEQRLGLSISQALRRMGERVASRDLRYFVTAVLIQTEAGGNLAEILDNIGLIVRERLKLKGKIKSLSAEGRFSALILGLLPVAVFTVLYFVNHEYIMTLFREPLGVKLMAGGLTSIFIGALVMKKMVTIKV
jgi:tight adherence protein B